MTSRTKKVDINGTRKKIVKNWVNITELENQKKTEDDTE